MKKILLFVNPNARQGKQCVQNVMAWANRQGVRVVNKDCHAAIDEMNDTILGCREDIDAVVVGGGDGSANAALPMLLETGRPLLFVPLGTANNLARTLAIPANTEAALDLLLKGRISLIDVGVVNGIPFLNVIGLGLSAQVNRTVRSDLKRWLGPLAFSLTAWKIALRMTPFRIHVQCAGKVHTALTWQLSICNGRHYGSGLTIHESATLKDATLHGLSMEVDHWWQALKLIPALLRGKYEERHELTVLEGNEMRVQTSHPMRVDIDGDVKTSTPLDVRVLPKALKIYLPPKAPSLQ